jgi:hypothetical protein
MAAVGPLWGTLHLAVAVDIVNASPLGVLSATPGGTSIRVNRVN